MICNNQITTPLNNNCDNGIESNSHSFLRSIAQVGTDLLLHTGLLTISAITFFTALWLSLYFLF